MANLADLILRGGAQQAAFTQNRYDILGNAVANLGGAIGSHLQQKDEQRQMAAREQAWVDFVESWDGDPQSALLGSTRIWGPREGREQAQALLSAGKLQQGQGTEKDIVSLVTKLKDRPEETWARWWPQLSQMAKTVYKDAPIPDQYQPGMKDEIVSMFVPKAEAKYEKVGDTLLNVSGDKPEVAYQAPAEPPKVGTHVVGGNLVDDSGKVLFTAPRDPVAPKDGPRVGTLEAYTLGKYGPNPTADQQIQAKRDFEAAGRTPEIDETAKRAQALRPTLDKLKALSDKIITSSGLTQMGAGAVRAGLSKVGWDDDFKVYSDLRGSLASQIAVAQQGSRPSDADVFRAALPLVPDPLSDTKGSAAQKWDQIYTMFEQRLSPEAKAQIGMGGGGAGAPAPSGFDPEAARKKYNY